MVEAGIQKFVEVLSQPQRLEPGKARSIYYTAETSLTLAFLIEVVGDAVHFKKAPEFARKIGVAYRKEGPRKMEVIVPLGDGGLQYYIPWHKVSLFDIGKIQEFLTPQPAFAFGQIEI